MAMAFSIYVHKVINNVSLEVFIGKIEFKIVFTKFSRDQIFQETEVGDCPGYKIPRNRNG